MAQPKLVGHCEIRVNEVATKCGGEEEKQEIESPWNAPCVSFGRHSEVSTYDDLVSLTTLQNLVIDEVVEDSNNKNGCVNENNPDTIAEASIAASKGKRGILEDIEPITVDGSNHSFSCSDKGGNIEEKVSAEEGSSHCVL